MKRKQLYLVTLFLGVFALCSCEDTDYALYDTDTKNILVLGQDTIRFTYGMLKDEEVDLKMSLRLIGFVDRTEDKVFRVDVVEDKTTAVNGVHYTLPESCVVPKDSIRGYILLDFHKEKMEKNKVYCLTLKLGENENFVPTNSKECAILFSNEDIPKPVWWQAAKVGDYNQEKFILFVDFFHKTEDLSPVIYAAIKAGWGVNLDKKDGKSNLLSVAKYQGYLKKYILTPMYEYYLETGDPIYEIPQP